MSRLRLPVPLFLLVTWLLAAATHADDWPQWRGPQRDGVWRETGICRQLPAGQLPLKWEAAIGAGYSGPTVSGDRVYVTDRVTEPESAERIHCFDAERGKLLWELAYPCQYTIDYTAGPRASVTVDNGRAYVLGAVGHVHCLDAQTGAVIWKRDLVSEYNLELPGWGLAAAPLVVGSRVVLQIGGRNGACLIALDTGTGSEVWRALDDRASYSAPVLTQQNGQTVIVCLTGESVAGVDPENGKVYWRQPFGPRRMPIGIATPVIDGNRIFVTTFYDGSLMLEMQTGSMSARPVWQKRGRNETQTEALHSIISTPLMFDNHVYGVDSYGELRCLDANTGERIWEDLSAVRKDRWGTIHFVRQADRVWMFNEQGELMIARLSPRGLEIQSRAKLLEPTKVQLPRGVCWSHPAFAHRCVFARNDERLVCASLAEESKP